MNARTTPPPETLDPDQLADAREETWRNLQAAAHYCRCCQAHLQYADDAVAIWDFQMIESYLSAARRNFETVRASFGHRVVKTADKVGGETRL